ncbi:MAG: DUF5050 domain-containing protein [Oscillospiraceae bacterium]|jgi:hypothetical protein|nr:DUF5050 domain-containing protein [Oscillospiraceae bacterium]
MKKLLCSLLCSLCALLTLLFVLGSCAPKQKADSGDGITPGNLSNGGFVARNKKFLFFRNVEDSGKLYRSLPDGSDPQKLTDDENVKFINAFDDRIYYVDHTQEADGGRIVSINPDGTDRQVLNAAPTGQLLVVHNKLENKNAAQLFYIDTDQQRVVYQPVGNKWGKEFTLATQQVYQFAVTRTRFYLLTEGGIYCYARLLLNNITSGQLFRKGRHSFITTSAGNEEVFFLEVDLSGRAVDLKRKKLGGSAKRFADFSGLSGLDFIVLPKKIIFWDEDSQTLCQMKRNGKQREVIAEAPEADTSYTVTINAIDDTVWLFFLDSAGKETMRTFPLQ